ncbi:hypothetical protein Egran_03538, partial [Elaphomyces granulatus]
MIFTKILASRILSLSYAMTSGHFPKMFLNMALSRC